MDFSNLGLSPDLLRAVSDAGYTTPTPIQAEAIPEVLGGRDILGIAQTGTGKTASFTLPMIDLLAQGRAKARMPRTLILEPTRELAMQVSENFETYGKYHKLSMALLIGGVQMGDQVKALEKGVDVLIATPGRLMDLFGRGCGLRPGCRSSAARSWRSCRYRSGRCRSGRASSARWGSPAPGSRSAWCSPHPRRL